MKKTLFVLTALLTGLVLSCSKSGSGETTCDGATTFSFDEPFYLCFGTEVHLNGDDNFTIRFDSLFADSRCPTDPQALCVWEGRADAGIHLNTQDFSRLDTLSATGLSNAAVLDSTEFSGYTVKLLAIEPYPTVSNILIPKENYKVKLVVNQ
ncbi:MAG: hypothetical protein OHK0019_20230 [Saprospiraceae bacterium]